MQRTVRTALPEGVPPEGLRILQAESKEEMQERFAELAADGYVPAQDLKSHAHYDEGAGEWRTLYVLPLWKVGGGGSRDEEMFR